MPIPQATGVALFPRIIIDGKVTTSVHYYLVNTLPDEQDAAVAVTLLLQEPIMNLHRAIMGSEAVPTGTKAIFFTPGINAYETEVEYAFTPPTTPDPCVSNNVAAVVQVKTGFPGRQYKGRRFISGIRESATVVSFLKPFDRTTLQTLADQMLVVVPDAESRQYKYAHWDRKDNDLIVATSLHVNVRLASQRRRMPR